MKRHILLIIGLVVLLSSCTHKGLCYNHNEHAFKYHLLIDADYRYDWEEYLAPEAINWVASWPADYVDYDSLRPGKPRGLRVVNYPAEGGSKISNVDPDGGVVYLSEGVHDILFYNNDTEYIVMTETDKFASTRATTRTRTRSSYLGSPFNTTPEDEVTVNSPDILYGNYFVGYKAKRVEHPELFEVTMNPLVFTYKIRFEFDAGLEYVVLARGTLGGVALSVNMSTGQSSDDVATILYDCELRDYGVVAFVNSFGLPGYPNKFYVKSPETYTVNLELRLKNGTTKSFDFDVTDQLSKQPHGGVIVLKGLEVTESEGATTSGAFDVTVNDWGEYEDIIIPLT